MRIRLVFLFIVFLIQKSVFSCSCEEEGQEFTMLEYMKYDQIFSGVVDSSYTDLITVTYRFKVTRPFKGVSGTTILINGPCPTGGCLITFKKGIEYLVFANKFYTNVCTRTRELHPDYYQDIGNEVDSVKSYMYNEWETIQLDEYIQYRKVIDSMEVQLLSQINKINDGVLVTYFSNGQKSGGYEVKNGVLNGVSEAYFIDGKLKEKGGYKNGKKHGRWTEVRRFYDDNLYYYMLRGEYLMGTQKGNWELGLVEGDLDMFRKLLHDTTIKRVKVF